MRSSSAQYRFPTSDSESTLRGDDLPAWLYQPIVDDFPRTWTHQGSTYSCEVDAAAEKVLMEPVNNKAKKVGEPPAKMLPRFRDFKVVYRQASRVLRLR